VIVDLAEATTFPWRGKGILLALALAVAALAGCVTAPPPPTTAPRPALPDEPAHGEIARNERFVLYVPAPGDSLESIAERYLGSAARAWEIADFNGIAGVAL